MKKAIVKILIILGILAVAVISCPDRQDHKDAIMAVVNDTISDELGTEEQGLSAIFSSIGSSVAGYFIDNRLTVKNYFVCSVGYIKDLDGEDKFVSAGVFGHVFTGKKEDLQKAIKGE